uniref:Probable polyketide synthase 45 n=1 Tax=Dictyostelium discoideum TaxID=44689 RepID=PKS45_DICDI|nr:RecName: Full=Probable polyketide synthase 45; Short=dipks45 [Dictyostelium discoideum]
MDSQNIKYGDNDVAIIGIGLRLPSSINRPSELWEGFLAGFDGIVETTNRWSDSFASMDEISSKYADEWMSFDPLFFGIIPTEVPSIDPQQRLLLKCTWEAFEDANIDPFKLRGTNTSVYVGASSLDYASINVDFDETPMNIFNSNMSGVSNRISYCFDFRGASLTIDTACSSSLNAVHLGYKSIISGESDYSIVGGCNFIMSPHTSRSFESANVTSKTGKSKAFDQDANGFVRSEGVVSIILKKMSKAIQDGDQIYSVIKGTNSNVDGNLNKGNFFAPSKQSQANNIKSAMESCNKETTNSTPIALNDIDFFELHGTSTQIGDPIECEGVSSVFKESREKPLLIGSIKANIGHLEPASGVASLAKVALMFKHRQFVKNINFDKPNPNIKFDEWKIKVCTENTPFPNNKKVSIAINSFGITGSNVCLILTEYIKPTTTKTTNGTAILSTFPLLSTTTTATTNNNGNQKYLIPISANSKPSLESYKEKLINSSKEFSETINFKDFVKYQLDSKTLKLTQRSVIIASNWEEAGSTQSIITTNSNRSGNIIKDTNKNPQLVFVFSGQGPQWSKMFTQLYDQEPIFKQKTDQIDSLLSKHYGYSILNKLNSIKDDDTVTINEPILAQPSVFMIQMALIELYKHWGILASISIGHSLGEVSSAVCSGMIDLETGCFIIYHRSRLQQQTSGSGKMLVASLNEQKFNQEFDNFQQKYPSIEIACFNSPSSIVLAGKESELQEISNILKEQETFSIFLGAQSSFHSSSQEPIKDELLKQLKDIKSTKSNIPNFSTVTSNLFNDDDEVAQQPDEASAHNTNTITLFDSKYVYENVRKPVQFEKTIKNVFNYIEKKGLGSSVIFLEISASPVLGNYIREMIPQDSNYFFIEDQTISVLSSLNKKNKDQVLEIQTSISQLYCKGYNVNFNCSNQTNSLDFQNTEYKQLSDVLFKYSWDDESYWSVAPLISNYIKNGPAINQLGNRNERQPYQSYVSIIDIKKEPFEFFKGHSSRNRVIYPGCGYIDSILKAFPDQDLTIQSMEFKSAVLLLPSMKTYLSTNITPSGKNEYRVSFHYKDKKTNKWSLSCSGKFSITKHNDEVVRKFDIEKLKAKTNFVTIQKKELYETIKYKAQFTFEGKFQSIEEVSYGHNCCLAKVPLTTLSSYDNQSFLNLCVIDSAFQPFCAVKENKEPMLFSSIENLKFFSKNIPKSAEDREKHKFVYTYTQIKEKKCGSYFVSILTMLQDGTILFFSPLVVYTQLTPYKNQYIIESPNDNLYKICYQSKDSTLPSPLILKDKFDQLNFETTDEQSQIIRKALSNCLFAIFKRNNNLFTKEEIKSQSIDYLIEKYCLIIDNDDDNDGIDDNSILVNGGVASIDDMVLASTAGKETTILNNGKRVLAKLIFQILKSNVDLIDWDNIATFTNTSSKQQLNIIQAIDNLIVTPLSVTNQVTESDLISKTQLDIINNRMKIKQYELISNTIATDLIKPIINNSILFRILEINSGFGYLSEMIINKINQLLIEFENSYEIEIEFTFTLNGTNQDDNKEISNSIKEKLTNLLISKSSISIIFKELNLNESFLEQKFNPSYYDLIVLTNLSTITNLNESIEFINSILYPNGHLIIIDTKNQSNFQDYEIFEQFLIFDNFGGGIVDDNIDWNQIFQNNNLNNAIVTPNIQPHVIQVQKSKLYDKVMSTLDDITGPYDQIIIIGDQMQDTNEDLFQNPIMDINKQGTDIYRIKTIEEFEKHCLTIPPTDKSILFFISAMNNLSLGDYKQVNFDYIKINQYLLANKLRCPFILATRSALKESTNALAASLIGSFRYFSEFSNILNLYSFDFGEMVFTIASGSPFKWMNMAIDLLDPNKHIQREYIFRNGNETWFERIGKIKRVKSKYQSKSYLDDKEDSLVARLNQNLEYQLEAKQSNLKENEIEVQVVATGINFKDSLIFRNLVPPVLANHDGDYSKPEFGIECSGIVSRIGSKVTKFKVGDSVLGISWKSTSSHAINYQDAFVLKPDNISFVEAASIPLVYCTSFYSLFYSGNLKIENNESVLIHQASGGIGLACLNILKSCGFKSKLYVTVGSKEKEDYLRETYGDFITGIYSSRNTDFLENIKTDLSKINNNNNEIKENNTINESFDDVDQILPFIHKKGVDLIINTLPFEFLDTNFLLLGQGGRIVDLSVNHLNNNDTTDFSKFKWFIGYSTVEIFYNGFEKSKHILQLIIDMIKNKELPLIPIKEYPINQIKDAIEFIGQRKHIGKIVINHKVGLRDGCSNLVQDTIKSLQNHLKDNYLVASPDFKFMGDSLGKTILLTGQTGLSLSIIQISLLNNYQDLEGIIVISKSPIRNELQYLISFAKYLSRKTRVHFKQADCSKFDEISKAISEIYEKDDPNLSPVESIFHNAFVPVMSEPQDIGMKHIDDAYDAKTTGAMNLYLLAILNGWKLKNFFFSSSVASVSGSSRQAGYCGANLVLESIAKTIQSQGIRCSTICWGSIGDIGYVSRNESVSKYVHGLGNISMPSNMVLGSLDLLLQQPTLSTDTTIVASFDFNNLPKLSTNGSNNLYYKFDYFTNPIQSNQNNCSSDDLSIREEILAKFSEFLSVDDQSKINLDIKLLDYGADSMVIVELKNYLDKTYTPNILSIQQLQNVTINQLIQSVTDAMNKLNGNENKSIKKSNKLVQQKQIDWVKEIKLDSSIKPTDEMIKLFKQLQQQLASPTTTTSNTVFLTGSSGFIGIYILFYLIKSVNCKIVYCLIRRKTIEEATTFLIEFLKVHQLYNQLTTDEINKIKPVLGDYTLDSFGLSVDQYTNLSNNVDLIINSAASVSFLMDYEDSKVESVEGVLQCLRFSCHNKLKKFVQVSTLGVYSDDKRDNLDDYTFAQIDPKIIQSKNSIINGYLQGKIVSEYHIKEAANRGIPCCIIRLPFIGPNPSTGVGNDSDFFQTLLQSCYAMSTYPKQESGLQLYSTPVTWVAQNLSFISMNPKCWSTSSNNPSSISENLTCYNLFGESICFNVLLTELASQLKWKPTPPGEFLKKLKSFPNEPSCNKLHVVLKNSKNLLLNIYIPGNYKLNPTLKQLLQSNNTYKGWKITPEMILTHLSFTFKKIKFINYK